MLNTLVIQNDIVFLLYKSYCLVGIVFVVQQYKIMCGFRLESSNTVEDKLYDNGNELQSLKTIQIEYLYTKKFQLFD